MARSLLIITPYFAPQTHAAVFRAYKLAKHLALGGWNIHVLTVDRNYLYNEDPRMLEALPKNVTVHTARYVEPTLRGLRMWLGGRDRTFRALKFDSSGTHAPERKTAGWKGRLYKAILERFNVPDVYWTWKRPAIRAAEKIIRDHGIDLIMTSSWPYTTLEIGARVKCRTGVPWVADIRDPMTYERRNHSHLPSVFRKQKAIEKLAVEMADAMTCTSSANLFILTDMYGSERTRHVRSIPTGVERDTVTSISTSETPYLIFVGEFLAEYGDEFFRVFEEAAADPRVASVRLKIVGRLEVNQARILPLIKNFRIRNNVDFVDHLPQQEVYKLIRAAKAGVLCTSRRYPWWAAFAKLCDFVAHHKPVVAIVPDPSEARKWLQLSNLGIFLDGPAAAETLRRFLTDGPSNQPVEEFCRTLYVEHQVAEFKRVFEECLGTTTPRG